MEFKNEIKQEYLANNQNPLVLLTSENGKPTNLIGHLTNYGQQKVWAPYSIRSEIDFESASHLGLATASIDSLIEMIAKGQEMPFLLADGYFPVSCNHVSCSKIPRLMIVPGKDKAEDIDYAVCERMNYDAGMKYQATGKLKLDDNKLRIFDFSAGYFDNQKAYLDTIMAVSESYLAKKGTQMLFEAKLK